MNPGPLPSPPRIPSPACRHLFKSFDLQSFTLGLCDSRKFAFNRRLARLHRFVCPPSPRLARTRAFAFLFAHFC